MAVVGALVLAGCSSGGGNDTSSEPRKTDTTANADDSSGGTEVDVDDDDSEQPAAAGEPVSHLPFDGEAPEGHRMIPGECEANADALAAAEDAGEIDYPSSITFAVQEDWVSRGKGSGGSGGVTGTDVNLTYESAASGDVGIEFEWETRGPDGESFDYEHEADGSTTTIEYEKVATVSVQDQNVDLFYRDPGQASDLLDGEEYKARASAFDLPNSLFTPGGIDEYSLVFTITFDADTAEIDQDMVESIIGSISIPTCVWDELLLFEEVIRQADLNGDGEVQSMDEWQAELMADLDEKMANAED